VGVLVVTLLMLCATSQGLGKFHRHTHDDDVRTFFFQENVCEFSVQVFFLCFAFRLKTTHAPQKNAIKVTLNLAAFLLLATSKGVEGVEGKKRPTSCLAFITMGMHTTIHTTQCSSFSMIRKGKRIGSTMNTGLRVTTDRSMAFAMNIMMTTMMGLGCHRILSAIPITSKTI
jgi:hypothetical protein